MSVTLLAIDLATVGTVCLLAVVGLRERDRPGALVASGLWLVLAVVAAGAVAARLGLLPIRLALALALGGWLVAVPLWAGFVFAYTSRGPTPTRRSALLAVGYVAVLGLGLLWSSTAGETAGGFVRIVIAALQTLLLGVGLFGVFLVVRAWRIDTGLSGGQALGLSLGGICLTLLLFTVSTLDTLAAETIPPTLSGVLATAAFGFATSTVGAALFEDAPATGPLARQSVLETMREAVVVTDREGRLVDANAAAERTFGIALGSDAGRAASAVVGHDLDDLTDETVTIATPGGTREFDVGRSVLTDRRGETIGRSYRFRDVTDRQTRRQRLEVLERVLRHNLRNDLDAIRGFAEALSEGVTDDPDTVTDRIDAIATDLVEIGGTVARAEQVMARNSLECELVDLEVLAAEVLTGTDSEAVESTITVTGEKRPLRTDREILRTALREVVANAVEHSSPSPTVAIDIERRDEGARIAVRDDGPGIPARERRVLLDGEENPLRHGSGVGLWFVSWAVTRLGGDLAVRTPDEGGSEVILTIPDRSESGR